MLKTRLVVAAVLLPVLFIVWWAGGLFNALVMALILGLAANEFLNLFILKDFRPARILVWVGVFVLSLSRHYFQFEYEFAVIILWMAAVLGWHLMDYEKGREQAPMDSLISIGAFFYVGGLGSSLILLRDLPNGFWWIMIALPSGWLADSGAYFIGSMFGKHKMAPRLSPKKSWEGYFGGALISVIFTPLLYLLYQQLGMPAAVDLALWEAGLFGLVISLVGPVGDLFGSMLKRMAGVKDSSNLLPGHGGAFDRIDTWIWTASIGFILLNLIGKV